MRHDNTFEGWYLCCLLDTRRGDIMKTFHPGLERTVVLDDWAVRYLGCHCCTKQRSMRRGGFASAMRSNQKGITHAEATSSAPKVTRLKQVLGSITYGMSHGKQLHFPQWLCLIIYAVAQLCFTRNKRKQVSIKVMFLSPPSGRN